MPGTSERPDQPTHDKGGEKERMPVERAPGGTSLIDVLDRILDKGIVIDAWVRISLVGIDLITVEARVVVASIDTYLRYAEAIGITSPVSRPAVGQGPREDLITASEGPAMEPLLTREQWRQVEAQAVPAGPPAPESRNRQRPAEERP
jgi:gas vesicle structural protein